MQSTIDTSRHIEWFDPGKVQGQIMVIGVGALGSMVALELAKLGLSDIILCDDDRVESHNLANQVLYGPEDIGQLKVEAAHRRIKQLTGTTLPEVYPWQIRGGTGGTYSKLRAPYIFICVDTMAARRDIFENCVWLSFPVKLLLDGRINAVAGQALAIEPTNINHVNCYREQLYDDAQVQDTLAGCRTKISVAATVHLASSLLMTLFIQHIRGEKDTNEILFNTRPWTMVARAFET